MADRTVVFRLTADIASFRASMAQAGASVKKAADDMTAATKDGAKFRAGLTSVGDTAGKVGLVAAAGLGAAIKASMDWETAWAGVTKTVEGSESQLATLEGQLRDMAKTMPATHSEIAAVAQAAGALGVATPDVASFTRTMIMLGEATDDLSADQAATSIAQMTNVMQTAPEDVDNLASALVALGNNGASTEGQIIQMAQRIAGTGAVLGLAEDEILAIANATASMGIEVEAGGTAVSTVFSKMATAAANGGSDLEAFATAAGLTAEEFQNLVKTSPADAFVALTKGLDATSDAGGNVFAVLKSLGLSDVRVSRAMLSIAGSGDVLTDSLNMGAQAWNENTALMNEYEKRADTAAARSQVAWNNIKDSAIEFGDVALPVVASAADKVAALAGAFGKLPGPVKTGLVAVGGLTAVLGGSVWAGSKVVNGVSSMRKAFDDLGGSASGARGKMVALSFAAGGVLEIFSLLASEQAKSKGYVDALTASLEDQTGALTENAIAAHLEEEGWLEYAQEIGLSLDTVTAAAMGNADAMREVEAAASAAKGAWWNPMDAVSNADAGQFVDNVRAQADALEKARSSQERTTEATIAGADAVDKYGTVTGNVTAPIGGMTDALKKQRSAARDTAGAFVGLGDSLNDAKVSLSEWIAQMADQASALRNFQRNAEQAANRGLRQGLIAALREAGPEGAMRMRQLANASDEELGRANRAWKRGQDAIKDYTNQVGGVPKSVSTKLVLNGIGKAQSDVAYYKRQLQDLDGTTATTWVQVGHRKLNAAGGIHENGVQTYATGGLDVANAHPPMVSTTQRVWAEPETKGEAYIPFADDWRRPRAIAIWQETGRRLGQEFQRFAAGGINGPAAAFSDVGMAELRALRAEVALLRNPSRGGIAIQRDAAALVGDYTGKAVGKALDDVIRPAARK